MYRGVRLRTLGRRWQTICKKLCLVHQAHFCGYHRILFYRTYRFQIKRILLVLFQLNYCTIWGRCNGYERSGNYSFFPEPNRMYLPIKVDESIYCNALRISQKYGYDMRLQDLELLQSLSYKLDLIF